MYWVKIINKISGVVGNYAHELELFKNQYACVHIIELR